MTTGQEEKLIDRLADWIARWGLTTPAIFLLETSKPFSFLGSQMAWMVQPLLGPVMGYDEVATYARLLQDRTNVERLLARLESHRADDGDHSAPAGDIMP